MNAALTTRFVQVPKEFVLSFTPDHGAEFLSLTKIREELIVNV